MKTFLFFVLFFTLYSCGVGSSEDDFNDSDYVIICLSEDAYAYHDDFCMGLDQCDGGTEDVTLEEAEDEGRTPCGFCY